MSTGSVGPIRDGHCSNVFLNQYLEDPGAGADLVEIELAHPNIQFVQFNVNPKGKGKKGLGCGWKKKKTMFQETR